MAVWLFGCSAFQFHPRTPVGLQCPTATVQKVTVAVRDCCGRITGHIQRAPLPGEKAFVQCHCAEKRTAHDLGLPPRLQPFFVPTAEWDLPVVPRLPYGPQTLSEDIVSVPIPPSVRPPDRA